MGMLGLISGRGGAAGSDVNGGLAVQRVPHHDQRQAHQAEGDDTLDRQAGAVASLADPGHLAGLFEPHLHAPAAGVAFHQLGRGGRGLRRVAYYLSASAALRRDCPLVTWEPCLAK
jgi:hypothetical protein